MGIYKPDSDLVGLKQILREVDAMFESLTMSRAETWKQDVWDKYLEKVKPKRVIALIDEIERLRSMLPKTKTGDA